MADFSTSEVSGIIATTLTALTATAVGIRRYLKDDRISSAQTDSTVAGIGANDKILNNLVAEVARLVGRVDVLEGQVESLTNKLASIRLIALDCYQIANECQCHPESRDRLLAHLKQIIKDA